MRTCTMPSTAQMAQLMQKIDLRPYQSANCEMGIVNTVVAGQWQRLHAPLTDVHHLDVQMRHRLPAAHQCKLQCTQVGSPSAHPLRTTWSGRFSR